MRKLKVLKAVILGELYKLKSLLLQKDLSNGLNHTDRESQVIVSLTSYGRRVRNIVDTTVISLLKQSYKPDRIILWLDKDNWNDDKLPHRLKRLKNFGVEIRYCKDIKSYKKLVPTLPLAGNKDFIITVDDDQYYPKDFIKVLVEAMREDPDSIHGIALRKIEFDNDHKLLPYTSWELSTERELSSLLCPIGFCGIIYKKELLHPDITNEKLFMNLAPTADDIWFFFMAFLNGNRAWPVKLHQTIIPIDHIYQKYHPDASLQSSNRKDNVNDRQFRAVMNYYNLSDKDLDYSSKQSNPE